MSTRLVDVDPSTNTFTTVYYQCGPMWMSVDHIGVDPPSVNAALDPSVSYQWKITKRGIYVIPKTFIEFLLYTCSFLYWSSISINSSAVVSLSHSSFSYRWLSGWSTAGIKFRIVCRFRSRVLRLQNFTVIIFQIQMSYNAQPIWFQFQCGWHLLSFNPNLFKFWAQLRNQLSTYLLTKYLLTLFVLGQTFVHN